MPLLEVCMERRRLRVTPTPVDQARTLRLSPAPPTCLSQHLPPQSLCHSFRNGVGSVFLKSQPPQGGPGALVSNLPAGNGVWPGNTPGKHLSHN